MTFRWWRGAMVAASCLAGVAAGECMLRSVPARDAIGLLFGRGHLLALVHGRGIYQRDVRRALTEKAEAAGHSQDRHVEQQSEAPLRSLIANASVHAYAHGERIASEEIDHELELLRFQFPNLKDWKSVLRKSGFTAALLRSALRDDLRADHWLLKQIDLIEVNPDECRAFYDTHPESFVEPERFRVSHLFLAAPPETAPDIVEQKRTRIEALSKRLAAGEDFFELVALESEDEASKARGGDLGFISPSRVPADFLAAVRRLSVGQISSPIRTQLGFHIMQVTDSRPAGRLSFEQVEPEIELHLRNQKRQAAVLNLASELAGRAEFVQASHQEPRLSD